jgi:hypothetical protein
MGRFPCTCLIRCTWRQRITPWSIVVGLLFGGPVMQPAVAAPPALPAVDLIFQVRVISEAELAAEDAAGRTPDRTQQGLDISSAGQVPVSTRTQEIRVLNGQQAEVSWSQALPFQWLQGAQRRGLSGTATHGGIVNALIWLRAGQSLSVQPRWPGGSDPVRVDLRLQTQNVGERRGAEVPTSGEQAWASTLSVPLGEWTTFAATGTARALPNRSTWSTQSADAQAPQWMQLRVTRH